MKNLMITDASCRGIKFSLAHERREVARAFLFILSNGLHDKPFGFMEDVYVDESCRGEGLGSELVEEVVKAAQGAGCYKLIACSRTSRPRVHALYKKLGFAHHGVEFRMNFAQ